VRFWFRNEPAMLPDDWRLKFEPIDGEDDCYRVRVIRPSGTDAKLKASIIETEFNTTSSRAVMRTRIPGPPVPTE